MERQDDARYKKRKFFLTSNDMWWLQLFNLSMNRNKYIRQDQYKEWYHCGHHPCHHFKIVSFSSGWSFGVIFWWFNDWFQLNSKEAKDAGAEEEEADARWVMERCLMATGEKELQTSERAKQKAKWVELPTLSLSLQVSTLLPGSMSNTETNETLHPATAREHCGR